MGEEILENWRRWRCEEVIILGDGDSGVNENMISLSTENTIEVCDYKCKVSSESTRCVCLCVSPFSFSTNICARIGRIESNQVSGFSIRYNELKEEQRSWRCM